MGHFTSLHTVVMHIVIVIAIFITINCLVIFYYRTALVTAIFNTGMYTTHKHKRVQKTIF